jgi:hypothetical protein
VTASQRLKIIANLHLEAIEKGAASASVSNKKDYRSREISLVSQLAMRDAPTLLDMTS